MPRFKNTFQARGSIIRGCLILAPSERINKPLLQCSCGVCVTDLLNTTSSFICPDHVQNLDREMKKCLIEAFKKTDKEFLHKASAASPSWKVRVQLQQSRCTYRLTTHTHSPSPPPPPNLLKQTCLLHHTCACTCCVNECITLCRMVLL